ncbi:cupin domain-containing protein [Pseudomonas sp. KnCO4]|uniref:cupin domain-containing protein n=1 Tax=Pseudomonas sp. KnCO4 TaxID=3381355 RepID=UPI003877DC49
MLVNADFSQPALVAVENYQWVASPQAGVERVMLDRRGGEKARATSIVRYAPQSFFPEHPHPGGEEILVLSGTFSEGDENFPAGYYLRNPPGSSHQPSSLEGATIFVKLWQMKPDEKDSVRIDTRDLSNWQYLEGRRTCRLFENDSEQVCLEALLPGEAIQFPQGVSAEFLVIAGCVESSEQSLKSGSWMRLPQGLNPGFTAGREGATVYLKTGHLNDSPGVTV